MTAPSVAVVIPIRNGLATLPGLWSAMEPIVRRPDVEVCFVDDASTDQTVQWLRSHGVEPVVRSLRGGPAAARNEGVRLTSAPLILFCDADTEPPPDVVERVIDALRSDDVVAVVGVYDIEPLNEGFWPRYKALQAASYHRATMTEEISWLWASMAGVKRDAFDSVGGFDERYGGADLEDVELGRRLSERGAIVLDRGYVVGHHFAADVAANVRNHFHRGRLWAKLFFARPAFDNYLTDRRHAMSRLLLVLGSLAWVVAGTRMVLTWAWVACAAVLLNIWLTRSLYGLAVREEGVAFAGRILLAETLMSWTLCAAGFRAGCDALLGSAGGRRPVDRIWGSS